MITKSRPLKFVALALRLGTLCLAVSPLVTDSSRVWSFPSHHYKRKTPPGPSDSRVRSSVDRGWLLSMSHGYKGGFRKPLSAMSIFREAGGGFCLTLFTVQRTDR